MNRILKWYLRVVLSRPIVRSVQWTEEERSAFELFCRTSCGIKLFEFLRQIVANQTFNAVYQDEVSANARARGMQDVLAVLHRLRCFPELQEESSELSGERDSEPETVNTGAGRKADDWHWLGGRGAIG